MSIEFYTVGFGEQKDATIDTLGGKGYNLVRMANMGVNVPPAVIVPTTYCHKVINRLISAMEIQVTVYEQLEILEEQFGYMPLFSVRSGAKVSCPGMLNTILNVGLCESNLKQWEKRIGVRTTWDSYRRLIQMFGDVVFGIDSSKYEEILDTAKASEGVSTDAEISVAGLQVIAQKFLEITPDFPQSFKMQLRKAISAVFASWNTDRAITYRNLHNISHSMGTAVIVQAMVFGNFNDASCTGVLFTRNPSTGEDSIHGEFLVNAQGEDVVAGIRTPTAFEKMEAWNSVVFQELVTTAVALEKEAKDMQDIEFTVQDGKLYILQTRNAKRTAIAAVKIATDLVKQGMITKEEAFSRVTYAQYTTAQSPVISPSFATKPNGVGIPASSGFASGVAVFSSAKAVELGATQPVILLSKETTPDDIAGMNAAVGILTQTGGSSSHAAVVARGMDKVCVVGCLDLAEVSPINGGIGWFLDCIAIIEGVTRLTIEGTTGRIWIDTEVEVIGAENNPSVAAFTEWAQTILPHMPVTSTGASGYLLTQQFDNNPSQLKEVVKSFNGIMSLDTGKANIEEYDAALFELVTTFDEAAIREAKIEVLLDTTPINTIHLDIKKHTLSSAIANKLQKLGYVVIPVISSLEGVVMANGLVRYDQGFKTTNAVAKVNAMKTLMGEKLQTLMFIDEYEGCAMPLANTTLVAPTEEVLKRLMS
jgi:pyruvate,orthophosphate dikinase